MQACKHESRWLDPGFTCTLQQWPRAAQAALHPTSPVTGCEFGSGGGGKTTNGEGGGGGGEGGGGGGEGGGGKEASAGAGAHVLTKTLHLFGFALAASRVMGT